MGKKMDGLREETISPNTFFLYFGSVKVQKYGGS